jgi:tetratricopeptide (TPR) repeat protein
METDKQVHLAEILQKLKDGRVVLFLGAGCSLNAGGPSGDELASMIKQQFPKVQQNLENLLDISQDVIDTPPYDQQQLEDFVVSKLDALKPSQSHLDLPKYDWTALFTTNYDNLIELAYQIAPSRLKPCYVIRDTDFSVNLADRSRIYLFKIMGCISNRGQKDGYPILTRADYNSVIRRRTKYLSALFDLLKNGTIVFVGYSGKDRLVFEVFDELAKEIHLDRIPYSYILIPKELSEKEKFLYAKRKMIHVPCDFEELMNYLKQNFGATGETPVIAPRLRLFLADQTMEFDGLNPKMFQEYFTLIYEDLASQDPGEMDQFFQGSNDSFGAFSQDWDFRRRIYSGDGYGDPKAISVKNHVLDELSRTNPDDNKVIVVKGPGGVGKTVMLKRLGYDVYKSGKAPVILIDRSRFAFDFKLLDSVLSRISRHYGEVTHSEGTLKALVLIDDAPSQAFDPIKLKNYLASRARPVLIVTTGRENEFQPGFDNILSKVEEKDVFRIDENLDSVEKERIDEHLRHLGYLTIAQSWDQILSEEREYSFFATMYSLVHPSRKPFNEIIRDQYLKLKGVSKEIFEHVCCFHQFTLPINEELLVRSLGCSYEKFFDVVAKDLKGLVYCSEDPSGTHLYTTHHRIIARKTVEFFFGDAQAQKDMFGRILSDVHFSNVKERELVSRLMTSFLGPHGVSTNLTVSQKRELFDLICDQPNPPREVVHHYGLLELENDNLPKAEDLLKNALKLPRRYEESFRGESDQNILTSLGTLYSKKGLADFQEKEVVSAEENFSKARNCFVNARLGGFPNPYAYHAHAFMFFKRGQYAGDMKDKMDNFSEALKILELGRDNLNVEDLQPIIELQTLVYSSLGRSTKVWETIRALAEKYKNPKGYYLYGNWLRHEAYQSDGEKRLEILKHAHEVVKEGLSYLPGEESLLMLQAKVLKPLAEPEEFYGCLLEWYRCVQKTATTPSIWLLYELAIHAFRLGFYGDSKKYFVQLDELSSGHRLKFKLSRFIRNESGRRKVFEGKISIINDPKDGEIVVDSLPNLKYPIRFRPYSCYFTPASGDFVRFTIGFDYVSPKAANIEKIV